MHQYDKKFSQIFIPSCWKDNINIDSFLYDNQIFKPIFPLNIQMSNGDQSREDKFCVKEQVIRHDQMSIVEMIQKHRLKYNQKISIFYVKANKE